MDSFEPKPTRCTYPDCGHVSSMSPCRPECRDEYAADHPAPAAPARCLIDYGRMGDEFVVCETHGIPFRYQGKVQLCPLGRAIADTKG